MLRAIVGIAATVKSVTGKCKRRQNRSGAHKITFMRLLPARKTLDDLAILARVDITDRKKLKSLALDT
jgi:hypothetical protein